jgi:hypothetical protein
MRALSTCIAKAGKSLSSVEAKLLKAAADRYRSEGFSPQESNIGAVSEVIAELEEDLKSIMEQAKAVKIVETTLDDTPIQANPSVNSPPLIESSLLNDVFSALERASLAVTDTQPVVEQVYSNPTPIEALPEVVPSPEPVTLSNPTVVQSLAQLIQIINNFTDTNTVFASVSTIIPPSMTLDDLKTLQASVQASDKIEDLKAAFANVSLFAAEIAKASEEMAKARKEAADSLATSNASLVEVKAQLEVLTQQHNEMVAAQAAAAAEQVYQERMASVAEAFVFDDETRAEVIGEIKACADEAAFAKWMARAKKLYKGWLKPEAKAAEMAPPFGKPDGDKGKECEKEDEEEDAKAAAVATAAKEALASAAATIVDPPITNNLDATKSLTLKEKLMAVAAKNIRIGGKTVEVLTQEASAARKTR